MMILVFLVILNCKIDFWTDPEPKAKKDTAYLASLLQPIVMSDSSSSSSSSGDVRYANTLKSYSFGTTAYNGLAKFYTVTPAICNIKTLNFFSSYPCVRDTYVAAFLSYSWAAYCYIVKGDTTNAVSSLNGASGEYNKAKALCPSSNTPTTNTVTCSSAAKFPCPL